MTLQPPSVPAWAWQNQKSKDPSSWHRRRHSEGALAFSAFLGTVKRDVIRTQGDAVEISLRRHSGETLVHSPGGILSDGLIAMEACVKGITDSKIDQGVHYTFLETPLRAIAGVCSLIAGKDEEDNDREAVSHKTSYGLSLSVPLNASGGWSQGLTYAIEGWMTAAIKTLASAGCLLCITSATQKMAAIPPSSLSVLRIASSFLALQPGQIPTLGLYTLASSFMFILSLKGLGQHETARSGNLIGMCAAAFGIMSVFLPPEFSEERIRFALTALCATGIGLFTAKTVKMEEVPQLVAAFHSFVGLAAVFCGFATYLHPGGEFEALKAVETFLGTAVGMLTFTGSVVAAGKLHEIIPGKPIIIPFRWHVNGAALLKSLLLGICFIRPTIYFSRWGVLALCSNTLVWGFLGVNMVIPIGGADMPVVVSLLNAFSGIATSASGFLLNNSLLTITGALVASSGAFLSEIMCRGINRSLFNVLLGGFGTDPGTVVAPSGGAASGGTVQQVSAQDFVDMLVNAGRILIVPGYGMAVARCQFRLNDIVSLLRQNGVIVHFGIHPVAGRLPGHMNVLLAEANVPYDIVKDMEGVNPNVQSYDVGIVLGANDIVNPATQSDPTSPIYGMPAIEIWNTKTCVVMKRSMATGYSGVDNPLFYRDNVRMLFGDAMATLDTVFQLVEQRKGDFKGAASSGVKDAAEEHVPEESYPPSVKVLGVLKERKPKELRVSMSPLVVKKFRMMGFSICLEAGAGAAAGFADADYVRCGGVQVVTSALGVLQQADVVLKVTEPLVDEVSALKDTQSMIAFWNMFGANELLAALEKCPAAVLNLALVPRISRAQKMDALTSMANIAGYRAVLDAFNRLPRFSRPSVSATGTMPPAKVFIIGAGIAGLSAIATAHAMGANVFANDPRDATRDQVEGLGAKWVSVDAAGISGEGVGGYATAVGEDFQRAQLATFARVVKDIDVVITSAQAPNRAAPILITEEMLNSMRKGSVIVDLAASTGGNCALTEVDKVVTSSSGIVIIGETNYASQMAGVASEQICHNFAAMLEELGGASDFGGSHWEDDVIRPATVVRGGQVLWRPPAAPPPPPPSGPANPNGGDAAAGGGAPAPAPAPVAQQADALQLPPAIEENKAEIALALGGAAVLALGYNNSIPEDVLTQLGYFLLSGLIGHFTVSGVNHQLHTPLISVTNAISGIIVVGGMLQLKGPLTSARVDSALAAVFFSTVNIVGGFAVTQRMLDMFFKGEGQDGSA